MILLNPTLNRLKNGRYGTYNFHVSLVYSNDQRTVIMIDNLSRMLSFPIPINVFKYAITGSGHLSGMSIKRSTNWVKVILSGTTFYFNTKRSIYL